MDYDVFLVDKPCKITYQSRKMCPQAGPGHAMPVSEANKKTASEFQMSLDPRL